MHAFVLAECDSATDDTVLERAMNPLRLLLQPAALAAAFALAACGGSWDEDLPFAFSATLESGGAGTGGVGLVTVEPDGRTLTASVVSNSATDTESHIHSSVPGALGIGTVVFTLTRSPGTTIWTVRAPLTEAQFVALQEGKYYFDLHNPSIPAGAVRGQIVWALPNNEQLVRLEQAREQSATVDLQLRQVQEIEEADDWGFTGIGLGFTFGF